VAASAEATMTRPRPNLSESTDAGRIETARTPVAALTVSAA